MGLVSKVGQNKGRGFLIILAFYITLLLGGVTMVIPFMMTLSTSVTNQYDSAQYNVIPRFLYNDDALYCKYLIYRYGAGDGAYKQIAAVYRIKGAETSVEFSRLKNPVQKNFAPFTYDKWDKEGLAQVERDWAEYWDIIRKTPVSREPLPVQVLYPPKATLLFQDFLKKRYLGLWREKNPEEAKTLPERKQLEGAIAMMNSAYGRTVATDFFRVSLARGDTDIGRTAKKEMTARTRDFDEFIRTLPADMVMLIPDASGFGGLDLAYADHLRYERVGLKEINAAWGTDYKHFNDILFSKTPPANPAERADWEQFIRNRMSLANVSIAQPLPEARFREFLKKKYGTIKAMNDRLRTNFPSFESVVFTAELPEERLLRLEWSDFIKQLPVESLRILRADDGYFQFLEQKYGTVEKLNAAYRTSYASIADFRIPTAALDRAYFLAHKLELRWYFISDNFVQVFKYMATQGNSMWNTLILVAAVLIAGLTVNPLAAYALSRYKIKFKQLILLVFLIPMAFPGEVMQIPTFILTRDMGLLNTYWALILPGLANGFGIFLMKGFFDGLPKELYEAAELDGANEWQIYWNVTYPMCKPIIVLGMMGSIIAAYTDFMFALIVCPDEKKWTLAVWIFQYSMDAMAAGNAHLQMAALVLMSIPTLIIFLIMQKIIMKGIILPSMK